MSPHPDAAAPTDPDHDLEQIARLAADRGLKVATAESLTCGKVAARLGTGPDASSWLWGGVVAYHESVKFGVLGVDEGPVVSERCARQLAEGVAKLFGVDAVIATTGVGGPDPQEGEPAGTVYLAIYLDGDTTCRRLELDGDPTDVLEGTVDEAVRTLAGLLTEDPGPA